MGLLLGALTLATGNLGAAVLAHFVVNYLNLGHIARPEGPANTDGHGGAPDLGDQTGLAADASDAGVAGVASGRASPPLDP